MMASTDDTASSPPSVDVVSLATSRELRDSIGDPATFAPSPAMTAVTTWPSDPEAVMRGKLNGVYQPFARL